MDALELSPKGYHIIRSGMHAEMLFPFFTTYSPQDFAAIEALGQHCARRIAGLLPLLPLAVAPAVAPAVATGRPRNDQLTEQ